MSHLHSDQRRLKVVRMTTIVILILTNVILLSSTRIHQVSAQKPTPPASLTGVRMNAQAAFDGYFKYGEWLPIWVEIENNGPDRVAELHAPVSTTSGLQIYTVPVDLPAGSRKRLVVNVLPNNFSKQIELSVVSGGERLALQKVQLNPQPTISYLVGIISPNRGALSLIETIDLPGTKRPVVPVDIAIDQLPGTYEGLRSLDLIVINDTDTSSLTPEQIQALNTWISQGGRLVVGGGAGAQKTASGLSNGVLPLSNLQEKETESLPGLEDYTGGEKPVQIPGPFVVATGDSESGNLLAGQDGLPLVREWRADRGWIDFIGLDLAGAPFDAWNGTTDFWLKLISPGATYPEGAPVDMSARQQFASSMVYPLNNLPMLDLPSVRGLALLLGVYILFVGPVNYLVLRKQRRLHLAWVTIPAITLIFSAASFGLGYLLHGNDIFINKIAILQPLASGKARVDSFIGLFSPARSAYSVRVDGGGLVSPLSNYYDPWTNPETSGVNPGRTLSLIQGDPAYINGLSVDQWSMQSFLSEGAMVDFGDIQADLVMEDNRLVGEVRNNSNYDLKDVSLIMGTKFARLGDIARGDKAPLEVSMIDPINPTNIGSPISYALYQQELSGANGPAPRQIEVRRAIVEALFERTPPYISSKRPTSQNTYLSQTPVLLGWIDQAPPEVSLAGFVPAQQATAAVVLPLTLSYPDRGSINLPTGLIPGRLTDYPREGGQCGMAGSSAVYIIRGEAIFDFELPDELRDISVDNLKLSIVTDSGIFNAPEISILNPATGDWIKLDGVNQGANLITDAAKFVDPKGVVKIRLSAENASNCFYLNLGLEGHR